MTGIAFTGGLHMANILAYCQNAIVTLGTITEYTSMIITAVQLYKQKIGGACVAIIAFTSRWYMLVGFADGNSAVMAVTAFTENLLMIDRKYRAKCGN